MRNIALIIMLFLLNSCSFNSLFLSEEIDKVTVVKYAPYVKHHRAYFTRTYLKIITGNQKYRFLYHPKKQELAILLHRKNRYLLYNFTKPNAPTLSFRTKGNTTYRDALKVFRRQGYVTKSLHALGYVSTVALRRYKGVKTLMVEVKDYRRLKRLYVKSIKNYDAKNIRAIKTVLPKSLIYSHYEKYRKRANTNKQRRQLQIIANTLKFNSKLPKTVTSVKQAVKQTNSPKKLEVSEREVNKREVIENEVIAEEVQIPVTPEINTPQEKVHTPSPKIVKGYSHYRHQASLPALQRYLSKNESRSSLSYSQYKNLQKHAATLQEEKLFKDGSLEELIAAYKVNKNPKYKKRIMILMKDKQQNK